MKRSKESLCTEPNVGFRKPAGAFSPTAANGGFSIGDISGGTVNIIVNIQWASVPNK